MNCYPQNSPMTRQQREGLVGKKGDKNGGSGDKGALMSCGCCFFKSIFSMADISGHSSGKNGWVALEPCSVAVL